MADAPPRTPRPDPIGPGQESVWDYPRPPRVEPQTGVVRIVFGATEIARTDRALRVLERSHPPTIYLPHAAFSAGVLHPVEGTTMCEFKGIATYFNVVAGYQAASRAAWTYPEPRLAYSALRDHYAVMPSAMDACFIDDELVRAQDGDFYGGWITSNIIGPFKGSADTLGW